MTDLNNPLKVIIVEDYEPLRELFEEIVLHLYGFEVIVLKDGKEAITFFQENRKLNGIAFIDFQMPYVSGDEVLTYLAQNSFCGLKKTFLFTNLPENDERVKRIMVKLSPYQKIVRFLKKSPDNLQVALDEEFLGCKQ